MAYGGTVRRWDVFRADLDPGVGTELRKTRPVIVLSNDAYNRHFGDITAIPVTKREGKRRRPYAFEVVLPPGTIGEGFTSLVQPFQIRALSKTRLIEKIGGITAPEHRQAIEDELLRHLGIDFDDPEAVEREF